MYCRAEYIYLGAAEAPVMNNFITTLFLNSFMLNPKIHGRLLCRGCRPDALVLELIISACISHQSY